MKAYTLTTFNDWYFYFGSDGEPGLRRVCERVAQAGVQRMYLRTHDGGLANYPTEVDRPLFGEDTLARYKGYLAYPKSYYGYLKSLDYRRWDPPRLLNDLAGAADLEPALWYTVLEDDHGGWVKSDFIQANPRLRCVDRTGQPVEGCLEFAFPEVQRYKRAILQELIDRGARRILLDLVRRNGTPSGDANGCYRYGFNPELIERFRGAGGEDPSSLEPGTPEWRRWVDTCAGPTTDFLVDTVRWLGAQGINVELLTWPVDLKTWMGIDLPKILATGCVDGVHIASQTYGYSPAEVDRQLDALRPQTGHAGVPMIPTISAYDGCSVRAVDCFLARAAERGVEAVCLHESDALIRSGLGGRFKALEMGRPTHDRVLVADRHDAGHASAIEGFARLFPDGREGSADQLTSVRAGHDDGGVWVRVDCHERHTGRLLPVPAWPRDNFNVLQLGARAFWNPLESVHLFVSLPSAMGDYLHLIVDPSGACNQESRGDERWRGEWAGRAWIESDRWVAEFRLPWATLGLDRGVDARLGLQVARAQAEPTQVTVLHPMATNLVEPREFGDLLVPARR